MDPTILETNLKRSVRKFFWDNIYTTEGINLYFRRIYQPPDNAIVKWVCIRLKNLDIAQVSSVELLIDLFTKGDVEGDELGELRDTVFQYLLGSIPLYDVSESAWPSIGSMVVYPDPDSDVVNLPDNGKMKTMFNILKWGAVY
jgi:hypothetical protein